MLKPHGLQSVFVYRPHLHPPGHHPRRPKRPDVPGHHPRRPKRPDVPGHHPSVPSVPTFPVTIPGIPGIASVTVTVTPETSFTPPGWERKQTPEGKFFISIT